MKIAMQLQLEVMQSTPVQIFVGTNHESVNPRTCEHIYSFVISEAHLPLYMNLKNVATEVPEEEDNFYISSYII